MKYLSEDEMRAVIVALRKINESYRRRYEKAETELDSLQLIKAGFRSVVGFNNRIIAAGDKLVLCFPDSMPEGEDEIAFNIPAYIVDEFRAVMAGNG